MDWDADIAALQDLTMTACESHRMVGELLMDGLAAASDRADAPLYQKILMAKLAAETVSALEDLGGLAWSVRNRSKGGILDRYIVHTPLHVRQIYESIRVGTQIRDLLKLAKESVIADRLSADDLNAFHSGLEGLERSFNAAAANYCSTEVDIVKAYNKLKHGFIVIVRLDKLMPGKAPLTDWLNDVNILTGITDADEIEYVALERSQAMADGLKNVIEMCANTAKELAYLMMFLWERQVPLDASPSSAETRWRLQ